MANHNTQIGDPKVDEITPSQSEDSKTVEKLQDCPVCLQRPLHPVELPCGHIFCFLCVKGFTFRSRRCAICRKDVPLQYFDDPKLVKATEEPLLDTSLNNTDDDKDHDACASIEEFCWYYEGRNGWWQYDQRATELLEEGHESGKSKCEILIAGFVYMIDFDEMVQYRKDQSTRKRHIKRDRKDIEKIGIAGLKLSTKSSD